MVCCMMTPTITWTNVDLIKVKLYAISHQNYFTGSVQPILYSDVENHNIMITDISSGD